MTPSASSTHKVQVDSYSSNPRKVTLYAASNSAQVERRFEVSVQVSPSVEASSGRVRLISTSVDTASALPSSSLGRQKLISRTYRTVSRRIRFEWKDTGMRASKLRSVSRGRVRRC